MTVVHSFKCFENSERDVIDDEMSMNGKIPVLYILDVRCAVSDDNGSKQLFI